MMTEATTADMDLDVTGLSCSLANLLSGNTVVPDLARQGAVRESSFGMRDPEPGQPDFQPTKMSDTRPTRVAPPLVAPSYRISSSDQLSRFAALSDQYKRAVEAAYNINPPTRRTRGPRRVSGGRKPIRIGARNGSLMSQFIRAIKALTDGKLDAEFSAKSFEAAGFSQKRATECLSRLAAASMVIHARNEAQGKGGRALAYYTWAGYDEQT